MGKRQQKVRNNAQEEIETVANEHALIDHINHHTQEETEDRIGLTWTNLSHIYFADEETIGTIHKLKKRFENKNYLVVIDEENNEACLNIQITKDLHDRILDE